MTGQGVIKRTNQPSDGEAGEREPEPEQWGE